MTKDQLLIQQTEFEKHANPLFSFDKSESTAAGILVYSSITTLLLFEGWLLKCKHTETKQPIYNGVIY